MFETHVIPLNGMEEGEGKFVIYRPLLGLAFIGNKAMANLALELSQNPDSRKDISKSQSVQFLKNIGFFRPDILAPENKTSCTSVTLLMTNQCQLRCVYCYAAAGESTPKILKPETAKTAIEYACKEAMKEGRKEFRIEFHGGGEPTLGWKTLQESLEYARSLPIRSHISITTNAMWTEDQCRWLIENMDGFTISMDGASITQDRNRPLASGKPSSPIVYRNIKELDEKGARYGIRMTAIPPWSSLPEDVQFILENTKCRAIMVEPAFNTDRGIHENGSLTDHRAFIEAYQEAYVIARKHKAEFRFPSARPGTITNCFCTAPYQSLIVNPEDQIVACYEVSTSSHPLSPYSVFGEIKDNEVKFLPGVREHLYELMANRLKLCEGCFCRWSCAGDCYVRSFEIQQNGEVNFGGRCAMNKELTTYQILHLISESGGVWQMFKRKSRKEEFPYG